MRILKGTIKWCMCMVVVLFIFTTFFIIVTQKEDIAQVQVEQIHMEIPVKTIDDWNWGKYKTLRLNAKQNLSNLAKMLYLGESFQQKQRDKKFKILMWKYGKFLEQRHLKHFTNTLFDPFEKCSVKNCIITYNETELQSADLIIIHLQRINGKQELPLQRKKDQIWAFLTDESPHHTFMNPKVHFRDFNGIFNWSMTYRMDSDIPVPYGRTIPLIDNEKAEFDLNKWNANKKQDVLIAILTSNCQPINRRWEYVKELNKYIAVDKYGRCGNLKCDPKLYYYGSDCSLISNYKFYLSFENSNCDEYITEKVWWQAYHKENIPIVMGSSKETYKMLLPPDSYLNVQDFASPKALADYVLYLNNTPSALRNFFNWKQNFKVVNEHGYFQTDSYHYCRACEALNYNEKNEKIYNNLDLIWSKNDCHPSWNN